MMKALKFKPKSEQLYLVYTSEKLHCMNHHPGNVYAVIGPFKEFTDKQEIQDALLMLLRGHNTMES